MAKIYLLLITLLTFMFSSSAFALSPQEVEEIIKLEQQILDERQNEIIVKYKDNRLNTCEFDGYIISNLSKQQSIDNDIEVLRFKNETDINAALAVLEQDPNIEIAEINRKLNINSQNIYTSDYLKSDYESKYKNSKPGPDLSNQVLNSVLEVVSTDPARWSVNVPVDKTFIVTYNQPIQIIKPSKIYFYDWDTFVRIAAKTNVIDNKLYITPVTDFQQYTKYMVNIDSTAITDLKGNITSDFFYSFTTNNSVSSSKPDNPVSTTINDTYYPRQYWLNNLNMEDAWGKLTPTDNIIKVAVIDSGIDTTHEDLRNRIAPGGYNFIFDNNYVYDINGHGSAVSGVIAAETNNYKGIAGVCGTLNVKVLPLQAAFYDGAMYVSDCIKAINYAVRQNVDVINMSIGGDQYSEIANRTLQNAIKNNIIVVASAGNDGTSQYHYPASYDNVISVGSVSNNNKVSSFSNHNDKIDVVAPGETILTTHKYNSYNVYTGTSFSCPIVAAVAALGKTQKQSINPNDVINAIIATSDDKGAIGKDIYYGYGLINPSSFLEKFISQPVIIPVTSIEVSPSSLTFTEGDPPRDVAITVNPASATNKDTYWTSSDNAVATMDGNKVVPGNAGTATITITSQDNGNCFAHINVVVVAKTTTNPVSNVIVTGPANSYTPVAVGSSQTFTASCNDTAGNPYYQFWVIGPNTNYVWMAMQDYSPSNTFTMNNLAAGSYTVATYAIDKSDLDRGNWKNAVYGNNTFVLNVGSTVTLSATYINGTFKLAVTSTNIRTPLYQFWVQDPTGNWFCIQDYSNLTDAVFATTVNGTYNFVVYAVDPNAPRDWTHSVAGSANASM